MPGDRTLASTEQRFAACFGRTPTAVASAPGRLEVLGNHTDYNAGLTLSCAVSMRCSAAIAAIDRPVLRLASTAYDQPPQDFTLDTASAGQGEWVNYVLGLVAALRAHGHDVPGFELLIDSAVPRSAGVSSSAALEMAVLAALCKQLDLRLPALELARIGQEAESRAVGAMTGLLDQLTALCGERDHLLRIDFRSMTHRAISLPAGWCFVAIDSGVKHDLTAEYNDRRAACEAAARVMGVQTLRETDPARLEQHRGELPSKAYGCAKHVIDEIERVQDATRVLANNDVHRLGELMFDSHASSRDLFHNSCVELDRLVELAKHDPRCIGARLSGGGFGGITIHLLKQKDAVDYLRDIQQRVVALGGDRPWGAVCETDDGAH